MNFPAIALILIGFVGATRANTVATIPSVSRRRISVLYRVVASHGTYLTQPPPGANIFGFALSQFERGTVRRVRVDLQEALRW